jgi:hypothetical protein
VSANERSIEPQGVTAAQWVGAMLGRGNRIATDTINHDLMDAYGAQVSVNGLSWVFLAPSLGETELADMRAKAARYFIVDHRLSRALPTLGVYFESGEPDVYHHKKPIDPAALSKFDGLSNIRRIFDSGDIVIYDVGELIRVP